MKQVFLNSARKSNRFFLYLIFALWGLTAHAQAQTTRYVSTTGTNTNPATATSWAASTTNLQGAIEASSTGDQVWVAGGIYKPTVSTGPASRTISFAMKSGVSLYGGFTGDETSLTGRVLTYPSSTTLSGDIDNDGTLANNSYHVISSFVTLVAATLLDGFVITGGNANGSSEFTVRGGGIVGCSPQIRNCSFMNNTSSYAGGAIYNQPMGVANSCILTVWNSSFEKNAAATFGGAIYINNVNTSSIPQPQLTNCSFLSNSANSGGGGALYNDVFQGSCSPQLTNCSFQNNYTHPLGQGGAIFTGPSANNSKPILTNCVLWNNGGANSISVPFTAPAAASYSLFDASVTGYTNVTGNVTVTASPFAAATSNELRVSSPAINAGLNAASLLTGITTDIIGRPRIVGARVDMGAYESQILPPSISITASASAICSGSLLSLTATASAPGITPADYNWSSQPAGIGGTGIGPTPTFAMPTVTTATTYTITVLVIDISQIPIGTSITTVTVNPAPEVSLINSGPVPCSGDAVTLTASGGSTYQFSDGATLISGSSASVSAGGIYSVTATGVGGCTATASTTVGNATPMQVFITPANVTLCNGQSVILTPYRGQLSRRAVLSESIGGARLAAGEFAYRWSTGETTESISATAAGTYSVTVIDAQGCKAIASTPVTVVPVPSLTLTTSANLTALCPGQLVSVSAIGCAGGTANWSTGETGRSIVVNPFSTTTLWANCLLNECTGPASNTLTLAVRAIPTVSGNLTAICPGGAAVLSVSTCTGGSVRWSSGQIGASITVRPTVTTSYSASCVLGSCTLVSGNSVTVAIRSLPDTPLLTLTANTVCTGQALPISYAGCVGGTLLKYNKPLTDGTQASWAICRNGCDSPTSNTVVYTVLTAPTTPTITASEMSICKGNSITLAATGCTATNETIHWSTGQTGTVISVIPTATTTYRATCQRNGCTSPNSNPQVVTVLPNPTISIRVTSASICAGASTVLTAVGCTSGVIAWSTGQQGQSFTISPAQSITYSARCTLATGCTAVSNTLAITVKPVPVAPVVMASTSAVCSVGYPVLSTTSCAEGTVRWSNNLTGPIVSFLVRTPTTYWATCTQTGCASPVSNSVTIGVLTPPAAPTITAVGNPRLCQGFSVNLRADGCVGEGETVRWSTGETGTILLATPLSTTTYQATCTRNGCVSLPSASFQVIVGTAPVVAIVGQTSLCAGSSTTLRVSGCPSSGTVTWSAGSTIAQGASLIVSPTESTTYSIQCKTVGLCTAVSNPFVIQVSTPDIPQITASTTALCQGGGIVSLTATGCGKGTIYWSNGQVGPIQTINVRATSGFYATCKLLNGCTSPRSNSVLVSVQSLVVSPTSINIGSSRTFSLTVSGCVGGTIYWSGAFTGSPNSLTTAGSATAYPVSFSTGPSITGPIAISALATIAASCRVGDCFDLTRNISVSWVSVSAREAITADNADLLLRVAPVPFTHELMVWLPDSHAPATVSLLDLAGRTQITTYAEAETGAVQLTTASLPSGVYLVEVWQNQRRYVKKVVK